MKTMVIAQAKFKNDSFAKAFISDVGFFRVVAFSFLFLYCWITLPGIAQNQAKEFFDTGKSLYDQKKYAEAREYFQNAVNKDFQKYGAKGNYHIALTYVKQKNCGAAQQAFGNAFRADSTTGGASSIEKFKEQLAKCGLTINDVTSNSATTNNSDNQYPAKEWFQKGKKYYEQGDYSRAIQYFKLAYLTDSNAYGAKACYQIALCYKKEKNCVAAKPFLAKARALDPKKGGASSAEKFSEVLKFCHFSTEDLENNLKQPDFQVDSSRVSFLETPDINSDSEVSIYDYRGLMLQGEILLAQGKYDSAGKAFTVAANVGSANIERINAYLKAAKAFVKANNCEAAFDLYATAYQLDESKNNSLLCASREPEPNQCGFTRADLLWGKKLTNAEKSQIQEPIIWHYVPFAAIALILTIIIIRKRTQKPSAPVVEDKPWEKVSQQEKLIFSPELQKKLNTLPKAEQSQLSECFRRAYASVRERWLSENTAQKQATFFYSYFAKFNTLWEKFNHNPEQFITGEQSNELIISLLLLSRNGDRYCYFTGQFLGEKASAIQIKHPTHREICVWASKSVIEKVSTKQPVKVRLHQIIQAGSPTWAHWSYDQTFFIYRSEAEKNTARMQEWKGETKAVLAETIPDIVFKPSPFYSYPNPDSIYATQLLLEETKPKTGYQQESTIQKTYNEPHSTIYPSDVYVVPTSQYDTTHRDNS